jgi:hypothetical protein
MGANAGQPTTVQISTAYYSNVSCTVSPEFLIANNNNIVGFSAPGSWLDINQGTEMIISSFGASPMPAAMWTTGSLPNALSGAIISVLDINFLTGTYLEADFIDNIIASLMQR